MNKKHEYLKADLKVHRDALTDEEEDDWDAALNNPDPEQYVLDFGEWDDLEDADTMPVCTSLEYQSSKSGKKHIVYGHFLAIEGEGLMVCVRGSGACIPFEDAFEDIDYFDVFDVFIDSSMQPNLHIDCETNPWDLMKDLFESSVEVGCAPIAFQIEASCIGGMVKTTALTNNPALASKKTLTDDDGDPFEALDLEAMGW